MSGQRQSAGRRHHGDSVFPSFFGRLARVETAGLVLCLLAVLAIALLLAGRALPGALPLVSTLGLHSFTAAAFLLGVGLLIWRRELGLLLTQARLIGALLLFVLASAGVLALLRPALQVGGDSLAEVTAGGELGQALVGSALGVAVWLALFLALVAIVWPRSVARGIRRTPAVLATVWSWRLPQRAWRGLILVVEFAFPTKPPADEAPSTAAPTWLPPETADEGEAAEPSLLSTLGPEMETDRDGSTEARLHQAALPMQWGPDEEDASSVPPPLPSTWQVPPMELLLGAPPADETARPDNAMRASLIVETLASFGVDTRVVQYHEGPVVTQFDVEPGWEVKFRQVLERDKEGRPVLDRDGKTRTRNEEVSRTRVRVNQITTLANDLALALAAPSLRIEAPVPGRSVVGIEVPNTAASVVTLRSVIETPTFQRLAAKTKLALPLGKSVSGEPVVADLTKMPHLLIAGATGSGKSVCINSIVASVLVQCRPEEVRFVMIDPKRVELSGFALIPHLAFSSIVVDVEKVVGTLGAVLHEMEARYKRFASLAVRNIDAYNRHPKVMERLPYWVVIIDELADLMMAAPFEVERQICRLAQLARATGIHLIIATQRPSVDVVTGLIKANFPTRVAFAMSSQVDSRTILDMAGAERLLGRGDMLYMATDASKPKRVQGVFVSDQEIDRLVSFWGQQRTTHSTFVYDHLLDEAQTAIEEEEDADPVYERAKALAEQHSRISTSMLQRRLRIGYPRAARLMDRLEDEGVVGDSLSGGSRDVLDGDDA